MNTFKEESLELRSPLVSCNQPHCNHSNLTNCDHCVLNLLRPHLLQPNENSPAFSQIQQLLKQLQQAIEREGVIKVAIDGQVQFMSRSAAQLLSQYFPTFSSNSLPIQLQHWFNSQISQLTSAKNLTLPVFLQIEQTDRQLIVHLIPNSAGQHLLLLEERTRQSFSVSTLELLGLTRREAEVLYWISKDKSNAAIAKILGCCEGTIRKHLENLYKKLHVQTRMGAVMIALEKLGLLDR